MTLVEEVAPVLTRLVGVAAVDRQTVAQAVHLGRTMLVEEVAPVLMRLVGVAAVGHQAVVQIVHLDQTTLVEEAVPVLTRSVGVAAVVLVAVGDQKPLVELETAVPQAAAVDLT